MLSLPGVTSVRGRGDVVVCGAGGCGANHDPCIHRYRTDTKCRDGMLAQRCSLYTFEEQIRLIWRHAGLCYQSNHANTLKTTFAHRMRGPLGRPTRPPGGARFGAPLS
jgi:hypothetical protein